MQCTFAEIEEKRKQAQLKLLQKNLIVINNSKLNTSHTGSPLYTNKTSNSVTSAASCSFMRSPLKSFASTNVKPYEKPKRTLTSPFTENIICTCSLITEDRFTVYLPKYNVKVIDVFKTISSRLYNSGTRQWSFHISDYEELQTKLILLKPHVIVEKLPPYVLTLSKNSSVNCSNINLNCIDDTLLKSLMPFQEEGVRFGIAKKGRCLIADEMGLGKTFQALAIALYYFQEWPLLVVTTASMRNIWEETVHKYIPKISIMHTQYMVTARDYINDAKVLIVSHDLMSRCIEKLLKRNFKVLIIDESHTFKNFKAKCTKAASALAKEAKRVILLSGTPALSRPSELYSQLSFVDENFFGNFYEYSKRYCDGHNSTFGWNANGKSNLQELEIILYKHFMIRRTKENVLKSLPNKEQEIVTLDVNLRQLPDTDRKCLQSLADNYCTQQKSSEKHAALLSYFSETAKIKIPSVCSYILNVLETEEKFIVFAHHQKMLDAIQELLQKKKKKYIRIDGNTNLDRRKENIDKFQEDKAYVCAILSITAANAGITLTAAHLVFFAELHWNPSILEQAESRVHRIGQNNKVIVKYLLAKDTADDYIWQLLQNKQKTLQEAGLGKESFENLVVTNQYHSSESTTSLNSSVTSANTLDIAHYFESKENISEFFNDTEFDLSNNKEKTNTCSNTLENDLLNDEFDELLSSVVV